MIDSHVSLGGRNRMVVQKTTPHLSRNTWILCHWRLRYRLSVAYPRSILPFFLINGIAILLGYSKMPSWKKKKKQIPMTITTPPQTFPIFSCPVTQIWPLKCQWKSLVGKDPKSSLKVNGQALLALIFLPISPSLSSFFLPGTLSWFLNSAAIFFDHEGKTKRLKGIQSLIILSHWTKTQKYLPLVTFEKIILLWKTNPSFS